MYFPLFQKSNKSLLDKKFIDDYDDGGVLASVRGTRKVFKKKNLQT